MSRKLLTGISGFFALALLSGLVLVPPSLAVSAHRGLTASGIAAAQASGEPSPRVTMPPQTSLARLKQATLIGPHAADADIGLTVSLKLRHVAQLKSFLEQVQNPASPTYLQFLTPTQFTARYGPSRADVAKVTSFLKQNGIQIESVSSNRLLIRTKATTSAYAHALGIRINDYELDGRRFYSTTDGPKLPRALAGLVQNVIGLDNAVQLQSNGGVRPLSNPSVVRDNAGVAPRDGLEPPPPSLYTLSPSQVAKAYDWPDITNKNNGKGVTIAIMTYASSGLATNDQAQLFWGAYGLPDHTVNVIPVNGDVGNASGMNSTLGALEWAGALAPGASFDVYVGATPSFSNMIAVFNRVVTDNNAAVASTSWGRYEAAWGDKGSLARTANAILMQAAAQGISVFAAAGYGASGDGSGQAVAADFPSSSPYVTAGNGTVLTLADLSGTYGSETTDPNTGGGISELFGQPFWQTGAGVPDTGWRMNSGMAMDSDLFIAYSFYNGGWLGLYGTATVAHNLGALFAVAVSRQPDNHRLGQSNALIYGDVNAGNYASDFRDITTGGNGAFQAGPDWDHPTGWGSPKAKKLIAHLGVQGPSGTLKGTVTDAASGAPIKGAEVSVNPGYPSVPTGNDGSYSLRLPAGDYTVTVRDFGYTNGTATVSVADGKTVTQDIALEQAPRATLSGKVTDGTNPGHDYGLYAKITIIGQGFGQVAVAWTDPKTGKYSIKLPKGFDYSLSVAAAFDGYQTDSTDVTLSGDKTRNFALPVLSVCTAPGYSFVNGGFGEDFNGSFPPTGWSVVDGISGGGALNWNTNEFWGMANFTGGTGTSAAGVSQGGAFDTSLVTPPIAVSSLPPDPILTYKADFANPVAYGANANLDVDISTDGGATWSTLSHWDTLHGGFYAPPGVVAHLRFGAELPATGDIQLRWRYYDLSGAYDYYAQVDDVVIGHCQAIPGGLVTGQVTDANTGNAIAGAQVSDGAGAGTTAVINAADPDFPAGSYVFFSSAGKHGLTASAAPYAPSTKQITVNNNGVTVQDFALDAARLTSSTDRIETDVTVNEQKTETFTIRNKGSAPAHFGVMTVNAPAPATATDGDSASVPLRTVKGHFTPASEVWARAHGKWTLPKALHPAAVAQPRATPWRDITPLPDRISSPAGAAGPGGIVYSVGGFDEALQGYTYAIYAYTPATGRWLPVAAMGEPRGAVAAAFVNGKLYIANGFVGYGITSSLVIYDPATGEVGYGRSNPLSTLGNSVGVGLDGKFYVIGGCSDAGCLAPVAAVQIYDPATNAWSSGPDYPHHVAALACGAIEGKLYCAGGHGPNYADYADGFVYDPADPDAGWQPIAAMPIPNGGLWGMAHAVGEGKLLVSGGVTAHSTTVTNAGYAYNPASDSWSALPNANHVVYRGGSACGFYRFGGFDVSDSQVDSAEVLPGYTPCGGAYPIPYLTAAPASGTLAAGASRKITLTWDGTGRPAFTDSEGYLKVTGATPYSQPVVALETHWTAQPVSLVLTGKASADSVRKDEGFSYTLTVENAQADGHGAATQTALTYVLPAGVSYVASGSNCAVPVGGSSPAPAAATGGTPGTVICDLGTIAEGASKTVAIAVKAEQAGTLTSHFEVTSRESNDSGKNTLAVTNAIIGTADLSAGAKEASIPEGGTGTIQLNVSNAGPDVAADVHFKVTADSRIKLQGATSDQGSCVPVSGTNGYACDLGDLASGATAAIQVTAFGTYAGAATVTGSAGSMADDPNPDNNLTSATITVTPKNSGGGGNGGDNGGGGALGWFALLGLFGLVFANLYIQQRRTRTIVRAAAHHRSGVRMSRHTSTFVLALAAATLLVGASFAPAAGAAGHKPDGLTRHGVESALASTVPSHYVRLSAQTSTGLLKNAEKLGTHAPKSQIGLTFSLRLRNEAGLERFLQQVQNPASPNYRHFLTPAQFTERYGPTQADVAKVLRFLKQHGIMVKSVSPNRLLIRTQATTEAYDRALRIRINDYRLNGRSFYSTTNRPQLPRALAGVVQNVIGLDNAVRLHSHLHFKPLPVRLESRAGGVTAPPPALSYLNPLQTAKAYDWPDITDTSNAAGVTIAILTYSSSGLDSLEAPHDFWEAYGLPDHTLNVIPIDGDAGDTSGMGETLLDVELSGAMAPGATLDVYVGATPSLVTTVHVMNQMVTDNNAAIMTTSWGLAESGWGSIAATANDVLQEAAAQGISMFAAAGDNGAADCGLGYCPPGVNNADFPSSSPYVTAANGTELTISDRTGTYGNEHAWSSTGGAVSQLFNQPDWQTGPSVPDSGWRMNSDLSMNGGPLHPYAIYMNGQWVGYSGTSAVAPQLAGLYAIGVSQQPGGARLGQSNSLLYNDVNAAPGNYASDFHDVTTGCNGQLPDGSPSCAGTNWDHPTGWGSPKATNLLAHLGIHGPAGTLKGTVTDAASGAPVAGATLVVTPGNINLVTADDGSYSRLLAVGDYTVTVTDFGYQDGSASVSITKDADTKQDFALEAKPVARLHGKVSDGSGHGYGLYALVTVTTPDFGQVASLWTDPATGKYQVKLPEGYAYSMAVAPAINGYQSASATLTLAGNKTKNFPLAILGACTAPGYKFVTGGFGEDFNGAWPPAGWTITNNVADATVLWVPNDQASYSGFGNWTGGTGVAPTVNPSQNMGANGFDTSLVSPPIPVSTLPAGNVVATFKANYQAGYSGGDALDLDVSSDGGATWQTAMHWTDSHGSPWGTPGYNARESIKAYLPVAGNVQLRWRYYNRAPYGSGTYAEIDDVSIGACQPLSGGLVMGQVTDANTGEGIVGAHVVGDKGSQSSTIVNPADPNLPVGFYLLFAKTGARTLSASQGHYATATKQIDMTNGGVVTQDFALDTGELAADPGQLDVHVMANGSKQVTFKVLNQGSAATDYKVFPINSPPPATASGTGNVPAISIPVKHPRYLTASLIWLRDHANGGNGVSLQTTPAAPSASAAWVNLADFPAGIADNTAARSQLTGKVYEMGGISPAGLLAAAFVYDPATNLWTSIASAPLAREAPVSAFVNGKYYVFDGWGADGGATAETDIYDPVTNSWSTGAPNPVPAGGGAAIAVVNGEVYIVGGCVNGPCPTGLKATQVYDPVSNSWSSAADYPSPILFPACGGIDGKLYCAGGISSPQFGQGGVKAGYVYDPTANEWSPIADIPLPGGLGGSYYAAANGKLLMASGVSGNGIINQGVAYDPESDSWSALPNTSVAVMRGASACGFYAIGGMTQLINGSAKVVDSTTVLPGYDRCGTPPSISWLSISPDSGSALAPGASKEVTLTLDGSGQQPFTTDKTYLEMTGNTPYAPVVVPLTVIWDAQPVSLVLTGSASPDPVSKGAEFTYSLTVKNAKEDGHGAATETVLSYTLPDGVSYVATSGDGVCVVPGAGSSSAAAATGASGVMTCDLGTLAQGAAKSVTIAVKAGRAGTIAGHFEVSSREPDDSAKNALDLDTTVIGDADLGASGSTTTVTQGDTGTVHLKVTNAGPDAAGGVTLKLMAGAGLRLQGATGGQDSCTPGSDGYACELGNLASGAAVDVKVTIVGTQAGQATLTSLVASTADDPNQDNNVATTVVTVVAAGGGSGNDNGGGGALGWLALASLIGLVLAGAALRRWGS